jgi:hypothetical protein
LNLTLCWLQLTGKSDPGTGGWHGGMAREELASLEHAAREKGFMLVARKAAAARGCGGFRRSITVSDPSGYDKGLDWPSLGGSQVSNAKTWGTRLLST